MCAGRASPYSIGLWGGNRNPSQGEAGRGKRTCVRKPPTATTAPAVPFWSSSRRKYGASGDRAGSTGPNGPTPRRTTRRTTCPATTASPAAATPAAAPASAATPAAAIAPTVPAPTAITPIAPTVRAVNPASGWSSGCRSAAGGLVIQNCEPCAPHRPSYAEEIQLK